LAELEGENARFTEAGAQVLGINIDHVPSHLAFAESLGGISFPILADFHPHGAVTRAYGLWNEERGLGKRAVFIIDKAGIVRWARVYAGSLPEIPELLAALAAL